MKCSFRKIKHACTQSINKFYCTRKQYVKGKGNTKRKYVYKDRTFQAENFDTSLLKNDQQIRKLLELKCLKTNCHGGRRF